MRHQFALNILKMQDDAKKKVALTAVSTPQPGKTINTSPQPVQTANPGISTSTPDYLKKYLYILDASDQKLQDRQFKNSEKFASALDPTSEEKKHTLAALASLQKGMTIQRLIDEKDIANTFHQFRSKPGLQDSNEKLAAFILENNGVTITDWNTLPSQIQDKLVSDIVSNATRVELEKFMTENDNTNTFYVLDRYREGEQLKSEQDLNLTKKAAEEKVIR